MSNEGINVAVISGGKVYDTYILPGTTAADVLRDCALPSEYTLSVSNGPILGDTEPLFGLVRNGDKLFASPPATVGCGFEEESNKEDGCGNSRLAA